MPGPSSSKVRRSPFRAPSWSASRRTVPPPPYSTVLRASSLAAVTILVWSTIPSPCAIAHDRTACLTSTTSWAVRAGITSDRRTAIRPLEDDGVPLVVVRRRKVVDGEGAKEPHPLLDVERRPN